MKRELPHNLEAEQAVLGSILIDPRIIIDLVPVVRASDFYDARHRSIFTAMRAMSDNREAIDFLTLTNHLERDNKLDLCGGQVYLTELIGAVPTALNAPRYAEIVATTSTERALLDAANAVAKAAYDDSLELDEKLGRAESAIYGVRRSTGSHMQTIGEATSDLWAEFQAIQNGERPAAVPTGFRDLDVLLHGWRRGEQTIVAARPGIGKTALLLAFAIKSAKAGYGTLIFSAEMSTRMCVQRMVQMAGVTNLPGVSKVVDWDGIADNLGQLSDLPLWIDDTPNIALADLRAKAMRLATERRIDHIFVDYVQLLRGPRRREQRYLEIGDITKALKQLCRELDNHVCTAAQLSRKAEDVRPTLDALKESGAIEEDADNVLLLHRAREIPDNTPVVKTEVILAKQRNGPTGSRVLGWMPERVTFVPMRQGGMQ